MRYLNKKNLSTLMWDLGFLTVGFLCLYFNSRININSDYKSALTYPLLMTGAIAVAIAVVYLFPIDADDEKISIYMNKRALILFAILESIMLISIFIMDSMFQINNSTLRNSFNPYLLFVILGLMLSIFICYFFKISLADFLWDLTFKPFLLVIILSVAFKVVISIPEIISGMVNFENIFSAKFIGSFIIGTFGYSIHPGIYEEILFRGFLISGLKGIGLSDEKSNVVQAIIFGASHVMSFGTASWIFLLATAAQAMIGYVLGKLYFKTKSLSPCILLHGLFDVVLQI